MHYQRWLRGGEANLGDGGERVDRLAPGASPLERFLYKLDKHGPFAKNEPWLGRCWEWTGRKCRGYGAFIVDGRTMQTHRWAYEHYRTEIPDGLDLDHFACDNRACCNPWHVRPVTRGENTARGTAGKPGNALKDRCKHGHEFTEENTYRYSDKSGEHRTCRTCARERDAKRRVAA